MPERPKAYRGSEPFVFVSYAHADDSLAYPLIAGLQERGVRVWFDDGMDIGDLWDEVLAKRVKQCSAMLCLVSTRFTDSNNCLDEIHNAKEQKKELLILHLEDEELPEIFQFRYSRFHALRMSAYSDQGELLDKLAATQKLRCCIGEPQKPKESPEEIFQRGKACYEAGSYEEAVKWYRKAADLGHLDAMYGLGLCYANGRGTALSHEEAVSWYRRAADRGNAVAMWNLGICCANGWGVALSREEAVVWYRRAAGKGDANAMGDLGYCYECGYGVPRSDHDAIMWYCQAADKGNVWAMHRAAALYANAFGDDVEAVKWLRRGAEKGDAGAMRNLAMFYDEGRSVEKSPKQATYWRNKAKEAEAQASK